MRWVCFAILLIGIVLLPAVAAADCYYNGERVPEGTRVGAMVCENGQWEYRP